MIDDKTTVHQAVLREILEYPDNKNSPTQAKTRQRKVNVTDQILKKYYRANQCLQKKASATEEDRKIPETLDLPEGVKVRGWNYETNSSVDGNLGIIHEQILQHPIRRRKKTVHEEILKKPTRRQKKNVHEEILKKQEHLNTNEKHNPSQAKTRSRRKGSRRDITTRARDSARTEHVQRAYIHHQILQHPTRRRRKDVHEQIMGNEKHNLFQAKERMLHKQGSRLIRKGSRRNLVTRHVPEQLFRSNPINE